MSFSSQKAVRYLLHQFQYYLLIRSIKTTMVFKRQQFKESKIEEKEPKVSKRKCLDVYDNKKKKSLDKYEGKSEGKDRGYVLFLFVAPLSPLQEESNRSTNIIKGTKNLNHLVCIPKIS